jgi:mRNA interferase RelE/StbE
VAYRILFTSISERQLNRLPHQEQARIIPKINTLAQSPRPSGVKKLKGVKDLYRIRVGDYRIIYEIQDIGLVVLVVKIGNRSDVYR